MQRSNVPTTVPQAFKITFLVWLALFMGQTFFLAVCLVLMFIGNMKFNSSLQNIFLIIGIFLPMILIFTALKIFNQRIENIDKSKSLLDKLNEFRTAAVIRWALIEACVFFNLVFFTIAGGQNNLLLGILILGYFGLNVPTKTKTISALQLNQNEIDIIYSK